VQAANDLASCCVPARCGAVEVIEQQPLTGGSPDSIQKGELAAYVARSL